VPKIDVVAQECDGMTAKRMLSEIDEQDNLSNWEIEFIDRMLTRAKTGTKYTLGQLEKINQIYDQRVG